ncbi:MAG: thioredoxin family protein [Puniceicoccales bacterium]|jgi:hypothetical protein|nr:thioredoxin family protein [Puniceicoccales bacterium]
MRPAFTFINPLAAAGAAVGILALALSPLSPLTPPTGAAPRPPPKRSISLRGSWNSDVKAALREGKNFKRPVLIYFMNRNDPSLATARFHEYVLNANYFQEYAKQKRLVLAKVDMDIRVRKTLSDTDAKALEIADQYGVGGAPCVVVIKPDGELGGVFGGWTPRYAVHGARPFCEQITALAAGGDKDYLRVTEYATASPPHPPWGPHVPTTPPKPR